MAKVKLKDAIKTIEWAKTPDPANLLEEIALVQEMFGVAMPLEEETALILEKAPKRYQPVLVAEIRSK